ADSALGAAVRNKKPFASQNLQDLAHGRQRQVRRPRELWCVARHPLGIASKEREQHDPVIGESRYADHLILPLKSTLAVLFRILYPCLDLSTWPRPTRRPRWRMNPSTCVRPPGWRSFRPARVPCDR